MPLRSVMDIEVNDAAFQKFYQNFEKFRNEAKNMPAIVPGGGSGGMRPKGGRDAGFFDASKIGLLAAGSERIKHAWDSIAGSTGSVVRNMREMGSRLLHMTSLIGLMGGLATGFGFLGMDALGRKVSSERRTALGLGTSIGSLQSFGLNFGRFVDPNGFLGGVSGAMRNPKGRTALSALGITAAPGEDTASVAARAMIAVQKLAKAQPEDTLDTLLESHKLSELGVTKDDLLRLRNTSTGEMGAQQSAFERDRVRLNLGDSQARGWQDFTTTLQRAGASIEKAFIVGLTPLAPKLAKLSEAAEKVITALLARPELKQFIDDLAKSIGEFAGYIGSPKFMSDLQAFGTSIVNITKKIGDAIEWIVSWIPGMRGDKAQRNGTGVKDPAGQAIPGTSGWFNDPLWQNPDGSIVDETGQRYEKAGGGYRRISSSDGGTATPQSPNVPGTGVAPGMRANNPFNMMGKNLPGSISHMKLSGGRDLAVYPDMPTGIQKTLDLLNEYQEKGVRTVAGMVNKWVGDPHADNSRYIADIAAAIGVRPDEVFDIRNRKAALAWIKAGQKHESAPTAPDDADVQKGVDAFVEANKNAPPRTDRPWLTGPRAPQQPQRQSMNQPWVKVIIQNETGGNAVIASNQVGLA